MGFSKNIFRILFGIVAAAMLYIGISFLIQLHRYFQFSLDVTAKFEKWGIEEVDSGKYIVVATYRYTVDQAIYCNTYRITQLIYPNIYLAQEHLEESRRSQNGVWVNPKKPYQSSLFRLFPFKLGVYLVFCIGIGFYFLWLNFHVRCIYLDG